MKKILIALFVLTLSMPAFAMKDSPNPDEWFTRAKTDLEDAHLVFNQTGHYDQVCFLAHQAVEKMLKGELIARGVMPDHSHYTAQLAGRYAKFDPMIKKYTGDLRELDQIYVPSRYPKPGFSFSKDKAAWCLQIADSVSKDVGINK